MIEMGDGADMPSLCSYDKGKKSFQGRSYKADVDSFLDFNEKMWGEVKKSKKRLPRRIKLIGNHEQRVERAISYQPELEGTVGYDDFEFSRYYDEVVHYVGATPGTIDVDGVTYAHFLVSGISGRSIGGDNMASMLLTKHFKSCTVGHSHLFDFSVKTRADGEKIMGLSCPVYQDYDAPFAGEANKMWARGVVIKRGVENGCYDLEIVSLGRVKKEYSK